jgi:hypothetical protein
MEKYSYPFRFDASMFDGLIGDCKILSMEIFSMTKRINNGHLNMVTIYVDRDRNFCQFIFLPKAEYLMSFKIDVYESQLDMFANGDEIFIQMNILPIAESLNAIKNHLRAEVEKTVYTSKKKKELRTEMKFYIDGEVINSIGSISVWKYIFSIKEKSAKKYKPWIEEKQFFD